MIYNLDPNVNEDVIANGVYESLTAPKKGQDLEEYLNKIKKEYSDCPFLHCPDYDLLVPINKRIENMIDNICYSWWIDEN